MIIKKEIKITGQDNDFLLEITNTKDNKGVMKVTESMNADEVKNSLEQVEKKKKVTIDKINNARQELSFYTKPTNIEGLYEMFKSLMNLQDARKEELVTGIKNFEIERDSYETEITELRSAYKRAKKFLTTSTDEKKVE